MKPELLAFALVLALGCLAEPSPGAAPAAEHSGPTMARGELLHRLDGRRAPADLAPALHGPDAALREAALLGLAHYHTDASLPPLRAALHDPVPALRLTAARGLAAHPALTPVDRERLLLGAVAAERDPALRDPLTTVLASALASVPDWLAAPDRSLDAVCASLLAVPAQVLDLGPLPARVLTGLDQLAPEARPRCLRALARSAEGHWRPDRGARAQLSPLLDAPPPEARRAVAVALLDTPALPWPAALVSPDPAVRIAAALRARRAAVPVPATTLIAGLEAQLAELLDRPALFAKPQLTALLALAHTLAPRAAEPPVAAGLDPLLQRLLAAALSESSPRVAAGWSLARCALAELVDRGRGWPTRVRGCGGDRLPPSVEAAAEARVLAVARRDHAERARLLSEHFATGDEHVKRAVVVGVASLPPELRQPLLQRALAAGQPPVVAEALGLLARLGGEASPVERQAVLGAAPAALADARVARAWLEALRAVGAGHPDVPKLAAHPSPTLRRAARALLADRDQPVGDNPVAAPAALDGARFPAADARFVLELTTSAGRFELSLDTASAPAAAVRLLSLVRAGGYDDQPIAAIDPGRSVALGPADAPPDGWLRHQGRLGPLRRGSVALVDHGRDLVSLQLLIALDDRPNRTHASVVGEVLTGLEVLDALTVADRVREARVRAR